MVALGKKLVLGLLRFYQRCISPLFPPCCRFRPTCSHYAVEAVQRFGVMKGLFLTTVRICKCHPFHPGGYDPVPGPQEPGTRAAPEEAPVKPPPEADRTHSDRV